MMHEPMYLPEHTKAAYQLRYIWTGWPSQTIFPPRPEEDFFTELFRAWETDGIRILKTQWQKESLAFVASLTPQVSPVLFTQRMKGRLQYALRRYGVPTAFSRKFSMRSIGEAHRKAIEPYIAGQVDKEQFASEQFKKFLQQFTVCNHDVDLGKPATSAHGRYWYNLHLVLVIGGRIQIDDADFLGRVRNTCFRIAEVKKHRISRLSVMPDHLHIALGGNAMQSPEEIALSYMNNLAHVLRLGAVWQPSYYVGSFGEYDMDVIRFDGNL